MQAVGISKTVLLYTKCVESNSKSIYLEVHIFEVDLILIKGYYISF